MNITCYTCKNYRLDANMCVIGRNHLRTKYRNELNYCWESQEVVTKEVLLSILQTLAADRDEDSHFVADNALLAYINDQGITEAFNAI